MASEAADVAAIEFGLIVIGDEVLNGGRTDAHLAHFKGLVNRAEHSLAWHWMLPDSPEVLIEHLRWSMARKNPVFVCGGIGATPDDHTRACAARAAGVELVRHPEALVLIEGRFGEAAYPHRVKMADLPEGCALIPNPLVQIPGFSLRRHYFLPGFPQMAWPMAEWVLEHYFPHNDERIGECSVRVFDVPESRLIPLMEALGERFPGLKMFSLPHMGADPYILLGFRGRGDLGLPLQALREHLDRLNLRHDGWGPL